jgi:hypothetical protein
LYWIFSDRGGSQGAISISFTLEIPVATWCLDRKEEITSFSLAQTQKVFTSLSFSMNEKKGFSSWFYITCTDYGGDFPGEGWGRCFDAEKKCRLRLDKI